MNRLSKVLSLILVVVLVSQLASPFLINAEDISIMLMEEIQPITQKDNIEDEEIEQNIKKDANVKEIPQINSGCIDGTSQYNFDEFMFAGEITKVSPCEIDLDDNNLSSGINGGSAILSSYVDLDQNFNIDFDINYVVDNAMAGFNFKISPPFEVAYFSDSNITSGVEGNIATSFFAVKHAGTVDSTTSFAQGIHTGQTQFDGLVRPADYTYDNSMDIKGSDGESHNNPNLNVAIEYNAPATVGDATGASLEVTVTGIEPGTTAYGNVYNFNVPVNNLYSNSSTSNIPGFAPSESKNLGLISFNSAFPNSTEESRASDIHLSLNELSGTFYPMYYEEALLHNGAVGTNNIIGGSIDYIYETLNPSAYREYTEIINKSTILQDENGDPINPLLFDPTGATTSTIPDLIDQRVEPNTLYIQEDGDSAIKGITFNVANKEDFIADVDIVLPKEININSTGTAYFDKGGVAGVTDSFATDLNTVISIEDKPGSAITSTKDIYTIATGTTIGGDTTIDLNEIYASLLDSSYYGVIIDDKVLVDAGATNEQLLSSTDDRLEITIIDNTSTALTTPIDTTIAGNYTISLSYTTAQGDVLTKDLTLKVIDTFTTDTDIYTIEEETFTNLAKPTKDQIINAYGLIATDSGTGTVLDVADITVNDSLVDYQTSGTYTITFSVNDSVAGLVTKEVSLTVTNLIPTLNTVTDTITVTLNSEILDYVSSYEAEIGEVTLSGGREVVDEDGDGNGDLVLNIDASAVPVDTSLVPNVYSTPGSYPVIFSFIDDDEAATEIRKNVTLIVEEETFTAVTKTVDDTGIDNVSTDAVIPVDNDKAEAGEKLTYTITLDNTLALYAKQNVILDDFISDGNLDRTTATNLQILDNSSNPVTPTVNDMDLTDGLHLEFDNIPAGEKYTITFDVDVKETLNRGLLSKIKFFRSSTIDNSITLSSDTYTTNPTDGSYDLDASIIIATDVAQINEIRVNKQLQSTTVNSDLNADVDDILSYKITVENIGNIAQNNVVVKDVVDMNDTTGVITNLSVTGTSSVPEFTTNGIDTLTFTDTMPSGSIYTITYQVTTKSEYTDATTVDNTVEVTTSEDAVISSDSTLSVNVPKAIDYSDIINITTSTLSMVEESYTYTDEETLKLDILNAYGVTITDSTTGVVTDNSLITIDGISGVDQTTFNHPTQAQLIMKVKYTDTIAGEVTEQLKLDITNIVPNIEIADKDGNSVTNEVSDETVNVSLGDTKLDYMTTFAPSMSGENVLYDEVITVTSDTCSYDASGNYNADGLCDVTFSLQDDDGVDSATSTSVTRVAHINVIDSNTDIDTEDQDKLVKTGNTSLLQMLISIMIVVLMLIILMRRENN